MNALRDAFAPYLAELAGCCCTACRQVVYAGNFPRKVLDPAAYWAAVSEQLRQVAVGEHQRVEPADWVAGLPPPGPRVERVTFTGARALGVGIGSRLRP